MISTLDDGLARRPDDGISNGVVAYHFAGRDELLAEVAREVLAKGVDYVQPRLAEARTGPEWLRTYIEANMAFMVVLDVWRAASRTALRSIRYLRPRQRGTRRSTGRYRPSPGPRIGGR